MIEILSYGFMQRAFLAGIFVAVACAFLGLFLVLRRDAMIGHGLAHVTFGGVALGLFLNTAPLAVALITAGLCSLIILRLKERVRLSEDTSIGIFSSTGMAIGIILATVSGNFNVDLFGYLFGNILAIDTIEVGIAVALAATVIIVLILFYQEILYQTFDPESAQTSGIRIGVLDAVLALLTSITVVIGMKVVGLLLVAALLVIPSAAGLQAAATFRQAMAIASLISVVSVIAGLLMAYYWNLPASGTIVLLTFFVFMVLWFVNYLKRTRMRS
ncbi:MAG TPA: metal ABC transporter permease [Thermodesulfobacteriota bacterium]|nr:metal ABC transporter permease [Thermodesulfobacteriota bacterium]